MRAISHLLVLVDVDVMVHLLVCLCLHLFLVLLVSSHKCHLQWSPFDLTRRAERTVVSFPPSLPPSLPLPSGIIYWSPAPSCSVLALLGFRFAVTAVLSSIPPMHPGRSFSLSLFTVRGGRSRVSLVAGCCTSTYTYSECQLGLQTEVCVGATAFESI